MSDKRRFDLSVPNLAIHLGILAFSIVLFPLYDKVPGVYDFMAGMFCGATLLVLLAVVHRIPMLVYHAGALVFSALLFHPYDAIRGINDQEAQLLCLATLAATQIFWWVPLLKRSLPYIVPLTMIIVMLGIAWDKGMLTVVDKRPFIDVGARKHMVQVVHRTLDELAAGGDVTIPAKDEAPFGLAGYCDKPTFVSLHVPRLGRLRHWNEEACPPYNVVQALLFLHDRGYLNSRFLDAREQARVKIDLLTVQEPFPSRDEDYIRNRFYEAGIDGIRFVRNDGQQYFALPVDLMAEDLSDDSDRKRQYGIEMLEWLSRQANLRRNAWQQSNVELDKFRTLAFIEAPDRTDEPIMLYRGWKGLDEFTADRIEQGLHSLGDWLVENIDQEGRFNYYYNPVTNTSARGYSEIRHGGSVYGLFDLYRATGDKRYLDAGKLGMKLIDDLMVTPRKHPELKYFMKKGDIGYAALALIAYARMPEEARPPEWEQTATALGDYLIFLQEQDTRGRWKFYDHYKNAVAQQDLGKVRNPYAAGEALLAWMYLYEETGNEKWLQAAQRGAEYYGRKRKQSWVVQALGYLARMSKTEEQRDHYARLCYRMADRYLATQLKPGRVPYPDYAGGFDNRLPPRSAPAASRTEALKEAYKTAVERGDKAEMKRFGKAIVQGAFFIVHNIYTPETAYYVYDPEKAIGGLRGSLVTNPIRIDYNQHAIVAVITGLEAARRLEAEGVDLADLM